MGFFRHPFLFFPSLFVTHVSPVCYCSQSLSLTSNFVSSSPVFLISFYLPFFALHVCRLIYKLSLCFVVHVVSKKNCFLKRSWRCNFLPKKWRAAAQLATQFPAEKLTWVAVQGLSVSFIVGLHGVALVWTDGRAGGRMEVMS